jgi:hypothetical protein
MHGHPLCFCADVTLAGLKAAIREILSEAAWQRCYVHFLRNAAYLERHNAAIKARHVSNKNQNSWYRTIDRIYPELAFVPKLLIPDIKGEAHIVYEPGRLYPHHNLYFIIATEWDLHALQAVLLSDVTRTFITLVFDENARRLVAFSSAISAPFARASLAQCAGRAPRQTHHSRETARYRSM